MSPAVRFTRHARNRLRFWQLREADVTSALTEPDRVTSSKHERKNARKNTSGHWVRVSYIEENNIIVVITVTVRSRGPEEE